jgi:hypothetical protein
MELNSLPPLPPTLTLTLSPNIPPDIPPDPSISMLFPKNTPYCAPNNLLRGLSSEGLSAKHKMALQGALKSVRGPFLFNLVEAYTFNGKCVGVDTPLDTFNSMVEMIIAMVE